MQATAGRFARASELEELMKRVAIGPCRRSAGEKRRIQAPGLSTVLKPWGVDEVDVHRVIRRVRLGSRVVERAATKRGGDTTYKTSLGPVSGVLFPPSAFLGPVF